MKKIDKIFFVAGDIFLPRIYRLTIEILGNYGLMLTDKERIGIHVLEKSFLNGTLSEDEYFLGLTSFTRRQISFNKDDLLKNISLDYDILALVKELGKFKEVMLFSDFPKAWLVNIRKNNGFLDSFKRVIYSQEMKCKDLRKDVLSRLMEIHEIHAGNCLWVDGDPLRTSAAIRLGIDAIIFVDERRLRRELKLRLLM